MAEQAINPLVPNLGPQADAMPGAQGMVFTATDRKLIKELAGEIDNPRTFKEIFFKDELNPTVENEPSSVPPNPNTLAIESRRRDHRSLLKHAALVFHKERVELSTAAETKVSVPPAPNVTTKKPAPPLAPLSNKTAAIVKELNLKPDELSEKFALDQKDLHQLVHRIRELHLKRLLCGTKKEFDELTLLIKEETLHSGRPAAKEWLEKELDNLTKSAAEYKLNLIKSLQSLHYDDERDRNSAWLNKVVAALSQS